MGIYAVEVDEAKSMVEKTRDLPPGIKSDKLTLDFGKTILRPGQGQDKVAAERKLPPIPGRAPAEEIVPEEEILNRGAKPGDAD
jgi:hypothetical protein